jgi:hypothetical protein
MLAKFLNKLQNNNKFIDYSFRQNKSPRAFLA